MSESENTKGVNWDYICPIFLFTNLLQDQTTVMEQAHPTTDYSLMFTAMKNELKRISEQQMAERHNRLDELSKSFTRGSRSRSRNRNNHGTKGANYEEYSRLVKMWK